MLTPEGLRAARALLKWGVRDVAAASGISWTTISQFENGRDIRLSTATKIIAAFAAYGVDIVATEEQTGATLNYARNKGGSDE
jgi:transcriptional regulator with XRE-family HTH domain